LTAFGRGLDHPVALERPTSREARRSARGGGRGETVREDGVSRARVDVSGCPADAGPPARGPADGAGRGTRIASLTALLLAFGGLAANTCDGAPRILIGEPTVQASRSFTGVCAVFLRIENPGDGDDALVRAAVDVPGAFAELHDVKDGKMVRLERIAIRARSTVVLGPGGPHVMVFNLPEDAAGRALTVRLVFERSGEKVTSVRIAG
jgi:copper(I)-binding protein